MTFERQCSLYHVRLVRKRTRRKPVPGDQPAAVVAFIRKVLAGVDREVFGVCYLNGKAHITGYALPYVGTVRHVSVEPRGILVPALLAQAHGIVLFHNHTSGDCTPSLEDVEFTRRMKQAGDIVGVALHDHIILGDRTWMSFERRGLI